MCILRERQSRWKLQFFPNKLLSIPPSFQRIRNNIRHYRNYVSLRFSIDPNCNISSKNREISISPQNEVKITIILFSTEIISLLTRLNFEEKKRKRNERPRRIVTQIYSRVFFFFLIVVRSTVYYAVFTEWREGGEREREGGEGPVLTARLTKARPPVKLIAHKMKRLFLWRWGRPITGVGRVQRRGTGAFSAIS